MFFRCGHGQHKETNVVIYIFTKLLLTNHEANHIKLEALRDRRPPWPRQIITPILPTVNMLSLSGERLLPPPPPTPSKTNFGSLPAPRSGYATTIMVVFFAHLLILEYPGHHQNLLRSSLYYPGPLHKISSQSVHNFLSNVVHRQTNKQTRNKHYQKHNLLCQGGNYKHLESADLLGRSPILEQVIVYLSVCLFICSAKGGQTARPNGLNFGG